MKKIKKYVEQIEEELCGAKDYAEKYIENKADGMMDRAEKYKDMANDELSHADFIHSIAIEDIERLNRVFTPSVDMQDKWDKSHRDYIEKAAWVKNLLMM